MSSLLKLAEQMRHEIDRSLGADLTRSEEPLPRHESPLWESGERDFRALSKGIEGGDDRTAVEIGCRSGRMLRAAARCFGRVVGVDLSELAVNRARAAIGANSRVELVVSEDLMLSPLPDGSADFVWSFSALSTMPPLAVAALLKESRRVLKPSGSMRLRLFLGRDVLLSSDGVIHPRAYRQESFEKAARLAGFEVVEVTEAMPSIGGRCSRASFECSGAAAAGYGGAGLR
jgi:SAM-dependent methyltransferase